MLVVLALSIGIRIVAVGYSALLVHRIRDWRLGFLGIMLLLMALRQVLTLFSFLGTPPESVPPPMTELPGLVVSILAFLTVFMLGRLLREREEIRSFGALLEESLNEIYSFDPDSLQFITVNRGARENLGYSMPELRRLTPLDLKKDLSRAEFEALIEPTRSGRAPQTFFETNHFRSDGSSYPVEVNLQRARRFGRDVFLAIVSDISFRKEAESKLLTSQARLREAQRVAQVGSWELDLVTQQLYWSDEVYRIFDTDRESFKATFDGFLDLVHPEDRRMIESVFVRSVDKRKPYDLEHRILRKDGSIRFVRERCKTFYDSDGSPLRSIGTIQDITAARSAQQEIEQRNKDLETLLTVSQRLSLADDMDAVFEAIPAAVTKALPRAESASLWLRDHETDTFLLRSWHGFRKPPVKGTRLSSTSGIVGKVAIQRSVVVLGNPEQDPDFADLGPRPTCVLGVPIVMGDEVEGVLFADSHTSTAAFVESDERVVKTIVAQAALAIENARLVEALADRTSMLLNAEKSERQHLARELHDGVGGSVAWLSMSLSKLPEDDREAKERLEKTSILVKDLWEQLRSVSRGLRPRSLEEFGLEEGVRALIERTRLQSSVPVVLMSELKVGRRFAGGIEITAFRVIQECLTNIMKHSGSNHAEVTIRETGSELQIEVSDSGKGFNLEEALTYADSQGISGMMERVRILGGSLTVDSEPGVGTVVKAFLPVIPQEQVVS